MVGGLLVQRGKRRCGKVTGIQRGRQEASELCKRRTRVIVGQIDVVLRAAAGTGDDNNGWMKREAWWRTEREKGLDG